MTEIIDQKERQIISIIKCIGIVLVVLGHSGFVLSPYIYMFHMALFFLISGYCFNESSSDDLFGYVKRKIKRIYIPYVLFGVASILLHNVFLKIGFYTQDVAFLSLASGNEYGVISSYSIKEMLIEIIKTLVLMNNEQLIGVSWFVKILFVVEIGNVLIFRIFKKHYWVGFIFGVLSLLLAFLSTISGIHIPFGFGLALPAFTIYVIGIALRHIRTITVLMQIKWYFLSMIGIGACGILYFTGLIEKISLGSGDMRHPVLFLLEVMAGFAFVVTLSILVFRASPVMFSNALVYIGGKTMSIMWLHLVAFKIVSFSVIVCSNIPMIALASFPVIEGNGLWIAYTIVGVAIPLLFGLLFDTIRNSFLPQKLKKEQIHDRNA